MLLIRPGAGEPALDDLRKKVDEITRNLMKMKEQGGNVSIRGIATFEGETDRKPRNVSIRSKKTGKGRFLPGDFRKNAVLLTSESQ